jgi:hypothetical protein
MTAEQAYKLMISTHGLERAGDGVNEFVWSSDGVLIQKHQSGSIRHEQYRRPGAAVTSEHDGKQELKE